MSLGEERKAAQDRTKVEESDKIQPAMRPAAQIISSPSASGANRQARHSVRFSPGTKAGNNNGFVKQPITRIKPSKVGKANPIRDLGILAAAIGFLSLIAYVTKDVGMPHNEEKNIKKVRELMKQKIIKEKEAEKKRKRKTECGIFLGTSSIPGTGFGIFAGKSLGKGDGLLDQLGPGLYYQVEDQIVSQYGLVLKHHPHLMNLERDADGSLKSSRSIEAGDELFLDFESHPHSILGSKVPYFENIPLTEDYAIANEIVKGELEHLARYRGSRKKVADAGAGLAVQMVRNAVSKMNPKVANLLPTSRERIRAIDAQELPMSIAGLKNQTLYKLELEGHCLDDVELRNANDSSKADLYAKRPIKRGGTIVVAPLYATRGDHTCSIDPTKCANDNQRCFGHSESSVLLCPLSIAAFVSLSVDSDASPNAEIRWSSWNSAVDKSLELSPESVLRDYPLSLSFDVIAVRDIAVGEKIIANMKSSSSFAFLPDEMVPAEWKDVPTIE